MESRKPDRALRICWILISVLLISSVIFLVFNLVKMRSSPLLASSPTASPASSPIASPTTSHSICILPSSGAIFHSSFSSSNSSIPIGAIGSGYYYVKLKDHASQKEVLSFFLHGKNAVNLNIIAGTYDLYFAHGDVWYGKYLLFGDDTEYRRVDPPIVIDQSNDPIYIWTPTVILGNDVVVDTTPIDAASF